ncbi:receptor-like protein kinase FERONIA [Rosa sericea]
MFMISYQKQRSSPSPTSSSHLSPPTMKPIITLLYLSLFLHIFTLFVAGQSPPYTPVDNITLACGNSGQPSSNDLRKWSGDIDSKFTPTGNALQSIDAPRSDTASQVPYTKARLSRSKFTYTIPLSPGQKFIRLHFNPDTYNPDFQRSNSLFSVTAAGFTLLKDFNASVTADASGGSLLVREFCVNIETGQRLEITFTPSKDAYAFINGIEIVSMPTGLYYTSSANFIETITSSYPIENNTALEMVYRINVGGAPISPYADTGMYRTWDTADEIYLDDISKKLSVLPQNNTIELNFVKVPEYSAPKPVYTTGRSMGMNKTINKSYNLTWVFPLDPKFYYLVRLHFCEFEPDITKIFDRAFHIFMANQTAEQLADVIRWSKANGNPVYRDYVVGMFMSPVGSEKKVNLFLVLSALQNDWFTTYNDAILNGLEIFKLSDASGNLAGPNPDSPPSTLAQQIPKSLTTSKSHTSLWPIVVGVISGVLLLLSVLGILDFRRGRKVKEYSSSQGTLTLPSHLCRYFSLPEMKAATQNFNDSRIIGVGGFGHVYEGFLEDGATHVAIKRLKAMSSQGAREFRTEIEMLSRLRHRNLVSLIGYCADEGEMILVYDYMARGTLGDHLYHTDNPPLLWEQRLQICIGAAQGLHYLHTGTKGTIIHRDVKSTNILLDEKWVAKVSDFGLSKNGTITLSKTHISTKVKGSFGYLDPEYYRRQQLTKKSDVYSFGVILCEVLSGRPAVTTVDNNRVGLAGWAKKCHGNGKLDQIIDPNLKGKIAVRCLHKFVSIAMHCMDDNGINRPSMDDVVRELQFALKMQQNNEDYIDRIEMTVQDRIALIKDNEGSCSSEQSSGANESVQGLTGTIFSEIIDPVGR